MSEAIPRGMEARIMAIPWAEMRVPACKGVKPTVTSHAPRAIWRKPMARKRGIKEKIRIETDLGSWVVLSTVKAYLLAKGTSPYDKIIRTLGDRRQGRLTIPRPT